MSRSELLPFGTERAVQDIVSISRLNNASAKLTGALVYTGAHFAQVFEGEEHRVAELLLRLQVDTRHSDLKIIADSFPTARSFGEWSMAYPGQNACLSGYIDRLLLAHVTPADEVRLTDMLRALLG